MRWIRMGQVLEVSSATPLDGSGHGQPAESTAEPAAAGSGHGQPAPATADSTAAARDVPVAGSSFMGSDGASCSSLERGLEAVSSVGATTSLDLQRGHRERRAPGWHKDYVAHTFYPASRTLWRTKESAEREAAKSEFIESLKLLEEELGDKCYFGGDHFGFVDIALIPFYSWFHTYESCGNFSIEAECPKIIAWAKRCEQRDAVKNSLPEMHKVSEMILGARKQYLGIE
uniref:Glutathione S-transferase n=1 Tax=Chenopodium quinoa TaxID=63459 RepID=A0A803MZ01_CHEQI